MPASEIAAGVHTIEVGEGITRSNVYLVSSGSSWVLIDTGSANCGGQIQVAADSLFGPRAAPEAILLTHDQPDHAGSARELAQRWGCPVYLHPDELPLATVDEPAFFSTYRVHDVVRPLDAATSGPLARPAGDAPGAASAAGGDAFGRELRRRRTRARPIRRYSRPA